MTTVAVANEVDNVQKRPITASVSEGICRSKFICDRRRGHRSIEKRGGALYRVRR